MNFRKPTYTGIAIALCASQAWAVPSGFDAIPRVNYPKLGGATVPVVVEARDTEDAKAIFVRPTRGKFLNAGVVKNKLTNCELVEGEMKISEINVKARVMVAQMMKDAQAKHQASQDKYNKYVRDFELANARIEPMRKMAEDSETAKKAAFAAITKSQADQTSVRELITIEKDATKIADLKSQLAKLEKEEDVKKKEFLTASAAAKKAAANLHVEELELAEATGKKKGIEKTLTTTMDEIGKIQDQLDKLQDASIKVLERYSKQQGAIYTATSDFAPAEYIEAMNKANPGLSFRYVPTLTAAVDATIPGTVKSGSPLAERLGQMVLNAKWSDPTNARAEKTLRNKLLDIKENVKDPVAKVQARIAEYELSLSGAKYLSLELSTLGYCALKEPESLKSEFNGGAAEAFKIALYYTYPVNYKIKVKGRYNAYDSLYEFHKVTKSSSWFGLSKKQKQEYVRRMSHSKNFDIKVEPIGMELSPQESLVLTEKIKEQLWFYANEKFLEKSAVPPDAKAADPGELGATSTGKRLMAIPNPWAFWGGLVLVSLGEMFGSSSSESIQQISRDSWVDINYDSGFSLVHSGDVVVGDLMDVPVKKEGEK